MDETVRTIERWKIEAYGEYIKAQYRAETIATIVAMITMFGLIIFSCTIGIRIFPEASTAIGKILGVICVFGSIFILTMIIGNITMAISCNVLAVTLKFQCYWNTRKQLRNYLDYLKRKEDEEP